MTTYKQIRVCAVVIDCFRDLGLKKFDVVWFFITVE